LTAPQVRLVLDTNVVASALLWGGKPAAMLSAARLQRVELFTTVALLAELTRILGRQKFRDKIIASGFDVDALVDRYAGLAMLVKPLAVPRVVPQDADDDQVIAAAVAANARLIVTGDSDLLMLGRHGAIEILSVAAACEIIGHARNG
jgi:uncharacterized protein